MGTATGAAAVTAPRGGTPSLPTESEVSPASSEASSSDEDPEYSPYRLTGNSSLLLVGDSERAPGLMGTKDCVDHTWPAEFSRWQLLVARAVTPVLHRVSAREGFTKTPVPEWAVKWISLQVAWMAQYLPCANTSLFLDFVELATEAALNRADVHSLLMGRLHDLLRAYDGGHLLSAVTLYAKMAKEFRVMLGEPFANTIVQDFHLTDTPILFTENAIHNKEFRMKLTEYMFEKY